MTPLYLTAQIRAIEQAHQAATPDSSLMERAGLAAATLARELLADGKSSILVLAGPGNNGGDAFVAARHLLQWWHRVDVVFTGQADKLPPDAKAAHDAWLQSGGKIATAIPDKAFDLVIDGLFGIGLSREIDEQHAMLISTVNAIRTTTLALDIPSGLAADSGRVLGSCIRADHTLTFIGLKPGLFTLDGPDMAGEIHLADLNIHSLGSATTAPQGWLLDTPPALPAPRLRNSHKGSYGSVGVVGGAASMVGAALLTARAALLTGTGRVYAGLLADDAPGVDMAQPELMLRSVDALYKLDNLTALAVGPGMGTSGAAETALNHALNHTAPLILDADALNLLASRPSLRKALAKRGNSVLTPHPGEAATLLGLSTAEIQADRIGNALKLAEEFGSIVVLKGCGSIIATPDGRWFINTSGNPGLSSAGMGDVLAGIIASLAAQGMALEPATLLAVHLHGAAADSLVANGIGPVGLTASEVVLEARNLLNLWTE